MGLVNKNEGQKFPVPHEPGEHISLRPLTWQEVKEAKAVAAKARTDSAFATMSALSPELLASLQGQQRTDVAMSAEDEYDMATVLRYAIMAWSYSPSPTLTEIDSLDGRTAQWAFEKAVSLFRRGEEQGESFAAASLTQS